MTTLDVLCEAYHWQGGTIHQAKEYFKRLNMDEKDHICNRLMEALKDISDIRTTKWFLNERLGTNE